jgi:hypothetical protein
MMNGSLWHHVVCHAAASEKVQPWNNSTSMEVQHTKWSTMEEHRQVMKSTTVIASVVNKSADRLKLPNGGYGFLGVCNDSVAMVQAGCGCPVTQFPCILGGQAKVTIAAAFKVSLLLPE